MLDEVLKTTTSDNTFAPTLVEVCSLPVAKLNGNCIVRNVYNFRKVINLYTFSHTWSKDLNTDFTLNNCLFGSVELTKNAEHDKYVYSGYGIEFDVR